MIPVHLWQAAITDICHIWDWLSQLSSEAATRISDGLIDAALTLGEFPNRHPLVRGLEGEVHRFTVGSWAVLYECTDARVHILRIAAGSTDLFALDLRPSEEK